MSDDAGSYSGGVGAGGGGNDWELVSLTASTYAAAPGPVHPLLDAHEKTELPRPAAVSAIFMSQHFNLPAAEEHANILDGCQEEEEESAPAILPRDYGGATDNLKIPCLENCVREQDEGSMASSSDILKDLSTTLGMGDGNFLVDADAGNAPLPQEGGGMPVCLAEEERQTIMLCSSAADSSTDGIIDSASLPAHLLQVAAPSDSGVARVAPNKSPSSRIPREAQAWWNKTFRFLPDNSKEPLTFGFVFSAANIAEFNVDSKKISCGASEPLALGQVKVSMLGGSPIAQG
ncbi:unnamed protein product [Alopecurus aequalis]